jgi:hypothetical protein
MLVIEPGAFEISDRQFGAGSQGQGVGYQLAGRIDFVGVGFVVPGSPSK